MKLVGRQHMIYQICTQNVWTKSECTEHSGILFRNAKSDFRCNMSNLRCKIYVLKKYVYEVHLFDAAVFIESLFFEVLIQIENNLFLNTINILTEYRYNSNRIYQELLEFIKYSFLITIQS